MEDAATGEGAMALQLMRAKQNAYYIHAVQDALQAEEQRKQRLQKAGSKQESKGLEKQFARERSKDRERLRQIQEDHALLLSAKIAQWKTHNGSVALAAYAGTVESTVIRQRSARKSKPQAAKLSKKTLDRLAVPRLAIVNTEDAAEDRPSSSAALTSRGHAETSQELSFYKDVYRKQDRLRLFSSSSLPVLNASTLKTMSETDLLRKKASLLTELHGVVSLEQRIIQDDQCTVRSSVSSWKSNSRQASR